MTSGFRPSPELKAITGRWVEALSHGQGEVVANLLAGDGPLLFCGSAENELSEGDTLRASFERHVSEIPAGQVLDGQIQAFDNGSTGWALWVGEMLFPSAPQPAKGRVSLVFELRNGIWKVVHIHNSFPSSNLEVMGYEHSVLDKLPDLSDLHRDDLAAVSQTGETGIASVMFTDVVDSSTLAATLGDGRWSTAVQNHFAVISDLVEGRSGQVVKSLGDGTMSTFYSAGKAMQAAKDIQRALAEDAAEPRLRVRIGIHTGDVVSTAEDVFGSVVNKAARVTAMAGPGEIRVSDATRVMVGGSEGLVFADAARVPLRGLDGDHLLHRLEWRE